MAYVLAGIFASVVAIVFAMAVRQNKRASYAWATTCR